MVYADSPDSNNLDEVLVVGQREAPITVVPRGLSVSLGEKQFEAINALNVEDLMKYAPNFFVRKRFAGDDNAVVALRGTGPGAPMSGDRLRWHSNSTWW